MDILSAIPFAFDLLGFDPKYISRRVLSFDTALSFTGIYLMISFKLLDSLRNWVLLN